MRSDEHTPLVADDADEERNGPADGGWGVALVAALASLTLANLAAQATRFLLNFLYMEKKTGIYSDPHINMALDLGMTPCVPCFPCGPRRLRMPLPYARTHARTRARARAHTHTHTYQQMHAPTYTHKCTA